MLYFFRINARKAAGRPSALRPEQLMRISPDVLRQLYLRTRPEMKLLTYVSFEYSLALERHDHQTTVHVISAVHQQIWDENGGFAAQLVEIHPVTRNHIKRLE